MPKALLLPTLTSLSIPLMGAAFITLVHTTYNLTNAFPAFGEWWFLLSKLIQAL